MAKIGVIGTGTWGTAIAILLANNRHDVILCSGSGRNVDEMAKSRRQRNLPEAVIPESVEITSDLEKAMNGRDILVVAVPSIHVRKTCERMAPMLRYGQIVLSAAKGIEEKTLMTMTDIIGQVLPESEACALSGPSHAEEVSCGLPTTCVVAAKRRKTAEYIQKVFMSRVFRVYTSPDLIGVETGGALKNVIALAAGASDGLGYGDNAKAALITRGIAEITRLGTLMGGRQETYYGLSGIGDLIVTCASVHSRNRRAGILIGRGMAPKQAMEEVRMVVEGVYSARSGRKLAEKYGCEVPIIEMTNRILFDGKPVAEAVDGLMQRGMKPESEDPDWQ